MAKFTTRAKNLLIIDGKTKIRFAGGLYETEKKNEIAIIKETAEKSPDLIIREVEQVKLNK